MTDRNRRTVTASPGDRCEVCGDQAMTVTRQGEVVVNQVCGSTDCRRQV